MTHKSALVRQSAPSSPMAHDPAAAEDPSQPNPACTSAQMAVLREAGKTGKLSLYFPAGKIAEIRDIVPALASWTGMLKSTAKPPRTALLLLGTVWMPSCLHRNEVAFSVADSSVLVIKKVSLDGGCLCLPVDVFHCCGMYASLRWCNERCSETLPAGKAPKGLHLRYRVGVWSGGTFVRTRTDRRDSSHRLARHLSAFSTRKSKR